MQLTFSPRRIATTLAWFALILTLASFAVHWLNWRLGGSTLPGLDRIVNVEGIGDLPSWFSSTVLLACGIALASIARVKYVRGGVFISHWCGLSLLFLALSVNKIVGFHLGISSLLQSVDARIQTPSYLWVLLMVLVILLGYTFYARFIRIFAPMYRLLFAASLATYMAGALLLDGLGSILAMQAGMNSLLHLMLPFVEEGFEMAGIILFLYALLRYMAELDVPLALHVIPAPAQHAPHHMSPSQVQQS